MISKPLYGSLENSYSIKPWTWALLGLIILDSIFTIWWGYEGNPLIVYTMNKFDISLIWAMVIRVFYCIIPLYIINKYDWSRFTFIFYIILYLSFTLGQFI